MKQTNQLGRLCLSWLVKASQNVFCHKVHHKNAMGEHSEFNFADAHDKVGGFIIIKLSALSVFHTKACFSFYSYQNRDSNTRLHYGSLVLVLRKCSTY